MPLQNPYLLLFNSLDGNLISFRGLDFGSHKALFLVGHPTHFLAVEGLGLFLQHLLPVHGQILEIWILRIEGSNIRHGCCFFELVHEIKEK